MSTATAHNVGGGGGVGGGGDRGHRGQPMTSTPTPTEKPIPLPPLKENDELSLPGILVHHDPSSWKCPTRISHGDYAALLSELRPRPGLVRLDASPSPMQSVVVASVMDSGSLVCVAATRAEREWAYTVPVASHVAKVNRIVRDREGEGGDEAPPRQQPASPMVVILCPSGQAAEQSEGN